MLSYPNATATTAVALKKDKTNKMAKKIHDPSNVRELAKPILKIFKASPELKMKFEKQDFTHVELAALDELVEDADDAVENKRAELTPLLNARNLHAARLHDVLVQARKAIAGYFGQDSDEYELAGGTRTSERKSPGRRPGPTAAAQPLPSK